MEQRIAAIQRYVTRKYRDTGQVVSTAFWMDEKGVYGSTSGDPDSTHMLALKTRAEREGKPVIDESWGMEAMTAEEGHNVVRAILRESEELSA